jgi:hypothetical protein
MVFGLSLLAQESLPRIFYFDNFGWFTLDFVSHYNHPPLPWIYGRPLHYEHHLSTFGALIVAIPGVPLFGITCITITASCRHLRTILNPTRKKGGVLGRLSHARLIATATVSTPNLFSFIFLVSISTEDHYHKWIARRMTQTTSPRMLRPS